MTSIYFSGENIKTFPIVQFFSSLLQLLFKKRSQDILKFYTYTSGQAWTKRFNNNSSAVCEKLNLMVKLLNPKSGIESCFFPSLKCFSY